MTLTIGNGPFGTRRTGRFNFDTKVLRPHTLYLEPSPKRVRVVLAGETVADSRRVRLLHETGRVPVYYFPRRDVRMDLLEAGDRASHSPFKGNARYYHIRVDGRRAENAVWTYPDPVEGCPLQPGLFAFEWDAVDAWYEEDEQVFVHPRDPYHRIDVLDSSRHVRVLLGGKVLAETHRPRLLLETGLPVRYYIPPEDVDEDLLLPSETRSRCPYKGKARYWSVRTRDGIVKDVAWAYDAPLHDADDVGGYFAFFNERVHLEVDGVVEERPDTRWARDEGGDGNGRKRVRRFIGRR